MRTKQLKEVGLIEMVNILQRDLKILIMEVSMLKAVNADRNFVDYKYKLDRFNDKFEVNMFEVIPIAKGD